MSTRPIAMLDVETTGVNPQTDRIIDLAIVFIEDGKIAQNPLSYRFNPGIPIPPEATAVHGIKDEDVAAFPPFAEAAAEIAKLLTPVDLAGFSPRLLDLPILSEEFERAGVDWEFVGQVIDVRGIYVKNHPRDLSAAVLEYLGYEHKEAHDGLADTLATAQVFMAQLAAHPELAGMTRDALALYSQHGELELADLAGKLARGADGEMVFTFGKHKGLSVRSQRAYAKWIFDSNFPSQTKRVLRGELDRIDGVVLKETEPGTESQIPF